VAIDIDKYAAANGLTGRIADYIVCVEASSKPVVSVVELKSGNPNVSEARDQIQGGCKLVEKILALFDSPPSLKFLPLLLYKGIRGPEARILRSRRPPKVRFQNREYALIHERCGTSLQTIIDKYP
jgi:hypothetical protein